MEIIFLGTGTSQGVPPLLFDSNRTKLDLTNPRNWRTRSSVHVVMDGYHVQVDAGPEFRLQGIQNKIEQIDEFILTHGHADHIAGMDDLRAFCQKGALGVHSTAEGLQRVKSMFPYAVLDMPSVRGYPAFKLQELVRVLKTPGGDVHASLLPHGDMQVLGLVFIEKSTGAKFVYYSDCKEVTPEAKELAKSADVMGIDALRRESHPTHLSLSEALDVVAELKPKQAFLTHTTALLDYETVQRELPEGVAMAYDGLRIRL